MIEDRQGTRGNFQPVETMPLLSSLPLAAAPSLGGAWWRDAQRPSAAAAQLRTYVVLTAKKDAGKPRKPALSFLLPDADAREPSKRLARHSSRSSNSSSCSTAGSDDDHEEEEEDDEGDSDEEPADDKEHMQGCLAYASYAAVAGRARSASLRWEDLDRRPRLDLAQLLTLAEQKSAKAKSKKSGGSFRKPQRATRRVANAHDERRAMGVALALEMSFAFLQLDDLQTASHTCRAFRDVVMTSRTLITSMYARQWRASRPLPREYAALPFADQLALVTRQNAGEPTASALSTRSAVEPTADGSLLVTNNSMLRSFARGSIDSVRGAEPLPWLACARALHKRVAYYEVSMRGCGSVGVAAVSASEGKASASCGYGFGSEAHVGWTGVSYGYHGNDGDFVFNDGSIAYGGEWKPFGPSWGDDHGSDTTVTIGCGLDADKRALFFTLNGKLVGHAPVTLAEPARYALAVSLHSFGDAAKLNLGAGAFLYDIEGYCASP